MAQYITIKNFGPIRDIERMEVKDFMVFIGESATGKSTIAKLIYFFKIIHYYYYKAFLHSIRDEKTLNRDYLEKELSNRLNNYFHQILITNLTVLTFEFDINSKVSFTGSGTGDWSVVFEGKIYTEIGAAIKDISIGVNGKQNSRDLLFIAGEWLNKLNYTRVPARSDWFSIYVPAQRAILASTEGQTVLSSVSLDELSAYFIKFINNQKGKLNKVTNLQHEKIGIYKYVNSLLKGDISSISNGKEVAINESGFNIQLKNSSSGQQEVIWVLLSLLFLEDGLAVIEEPESHLDPGRQVSIIDAIATFGNMNSNQVIITTHSPYILGAVNNLIYAYNVGQNHSEQVVALIPNEAWLDPSRVAAYRVKEGGIESIVSEDTLLDGEGLNETSIAIDERYSRLFMIQRDTD